MLINQEIAIHNLRLLCAAPDLAGIGVDGDNQRLTYGSISSDQQRLLLAIINNTFAFAEAQEALGHPLWIEIPVSGTLSISCTAGHVLSHLSPPPNTVFDRRLLKDLVEQHHVVTITCRDTIIRAHSETLIESSLFFRNLFASPFKEQKELRADIDCSPEVLQVVIHFFEGKDLPPINENITDLLAIAAFLCSDRLDQALAHLLTRSNNLDDESWKILFNIHPTIFLLMKKPPEETLDILTILLTTVAIEDRHIQELLIGLINNNTLSFTALLSLVGGLENLYALFPARLIRTIRVLNLKKPNLSCEQMMTVILQCPHLTELALPYTVSGTFLDCLQHTPHLQRLDIEGCSELVPDCLNNLCHVSSLQHLNIGCCPKLAAAALEHLRSVPLLKWLNIQSCYSLAKDSLQYLKYTPMLQHLCMEYSSQAATCLEYLCFVPSLVHLNIAGCSLAAGSLQYLKHTPMLQHLNMANTKFAPDCLQTLQHVPYLLYLDICGCELEPNCLDNLSHVPMLQHLRLNGFYSLSEHALNNLKHVRELQSLQIWQCRFLAPTCLINLRYVPKLLHLDIRQCIQLSPRCLDHLCHVPLLQRLQLDNCRLSADALNNLKSTPNLSILNLPWCKGLDPHCLSNLKYVQRLRHLNLSYLRLDPRCLNHLDQVPDLRSLEINQCLRLEKKALKNLSLVNKLKSLAMQQCPHLNTAHIPSHVQVIYY